MLQNVIISINITLPMMLLVVLGIYLKRTDFINRVFLAVANRLVFLVAIPSLLFTTISRSDITYMLDGAFMVFVALTTVIFFALSWVGAYVVFRGKHPHAIGSFVQAAFRGNLATLALPVLINLLGEQAGKGALVLAVLIPLYNVLAVMVLSAHGSGEQSVSVKALGIGLLKNRLIHATVLGILVSVLSVPVPVVVNSTLDMLAQLTIPLALICLGAGLRFEGFSGRFVWVLWAGVLKLVLMPLFVFVSALWLGFTGADMVILIVMAATPTSITSYVMATEMGGDEYIAGTSIVVSSLLSGVTLTLWMFALLTLGFLS